MVLLHIALQDGFRNNTVLMRLNGKRIYRKNNLKTRTQIGLADSVELETDEGPASLEVSLPQERIVGSIAFVLKSVTYIGVSIIEGEVQFKVQNVPFGYL